MNGETMDESTKSQKNQNDILSPLELANNNKNGEKEEEQTLSDPNLQKLIIEQKCKSKPAFEKNGTDDGSEVNESKEILENNDKNTKEACQKNLTATTNGLDKDEVKQTVKVFPQPDSEFENSNSCQEKIVSIDTLDNGDHIFKNHINDQAEESDSTKSDMAKKELLVMVMESDDSSEEMLGSDLDPQTEETYSIVSGSENDEPIFPQIEEKKENTEECIVTTENKTGRNKKNSNIKKPCTTELRRSSRTVKRRKYSYDENADEESDVEEVVPDETLKRRSRPIMINDTKSLVEIAARQAARSTASERREPQLVLIGSNPTAKAAIPKSTTSSINTSLYQSIVARGTTVTPVPSKPASTTTSQAVQTSPTPTPTVLPSLTDDMFVVEAPSFIVPYVYEKPSIEPFKEFVTKLGKDIEDQRVKAEKELLEKKKEEKAKRQKERQERKDNGEEVTDSEEEARREAEENKKKKIAKKEQKKRRQEEDDSSWDGSDSTDSEDFKITDENGTTIVINDNKEATGESKNLENVSTSTSNSNSYFECSLGKFFTSIGMGLVEEYVQSDLLKQQKRKLQREKKSGQSTKEREMSICLLMKNLKISKENNEPFTCVQMKCEHCSFKTESALVLAQHLETPHMKNNMYKCNFCKFEIRSPHDILFHMEAEHNVRGKLERAPAYHQCVNCPFEDNGKGKLARHIVACAKKFKPEHNLSPPFDWEPPAKIPKVAKARQTMLGAAFPPTSSFGRPQLASSFGRPAVVTGMIPGVSNYRPRTRLPGPPLLRPIMAGGSIVRGSSMLQQTSLAASNTNAKKNQPSISITPLPRQTAPPNDPGALNAAGTFVICEICDGYIKDLDQLRNHMQWIHRVKIHPKMIYNRPPLNCQKCQFRFFTDMGLERHLLGSHGLVTSSMQEAANKSKDAGRCPVCGKVYQWKLLNHMARDHNMTLKPAHLSYKCTVCAATFEMYKLFENHVYSAHSVVAKRVIDKVPAKVKSNGPKGLKINDEITITAQPAKASKDK